MSHTLSFALVNTPAVSEFENRSFLAVEVVPYANGQLLYASQRGDIFDAIGVPLQGTESDETDLFTCSCGVAGCAGIHESCYVRADAQTVSWEFPEDPFRQRLNPAVFAIGAPLKLTFERMHYEEALAQLEQDLERNRLESGLPTATAPCNEPADTELNQTVHAFLASCRKRRAEHQAWQQATRDAEGELARHEVLATLTDGTQLTCTLSMVAWDLLDAGASPEERLEQLRNSVRDQVLADPLLAVSRMQPKLLEDLCSPVDYTVEVPAGWASLSTVVWSVRPVTTAT